MYELTVNMPNRPQGAEITVDGIGKLENGKPVQLTDKQVRQFQMKHQHLWEPFTKQETEPGLDTILESVPGFTVKRLVPGGNLSNQNDQGGSNNEDNNTGEGDEK